MPAPIDHLSATPVEILLDVFSNLSTNDLFSLSALSRVLHEPANHLLYDSIELSSEFSADLLLRERKSLSSTQSLRLLGDASEGVTRENAVKILNLCLNLVDLKIESFAAFDCRVLNTPALSQLQELFLDTRLIPFSGPFQFSFNLVRLQLSGSTGYPYSLIAALLSNELRSLILPYSLFSQLNEMLPELSALKSIAITGTGDADLTHSDWIDFLESCEKYGIKLKFDL